MKIMVTVLIMVCSFSIGHSIRQKYKNEYDFLSYLKNFIVYLKSNFNMFKDDIVSIIDKYIQIQNDNNYNSIFVKSYGIYDIDKNAIELNNSSGEDVLTIYTFLNSLGKNNYEFEEEKINGFLSFLEIKMIDYSNNIQSKGVLSQKILLAFGLIISILVW